MIGAFFNKVQKIVNTVNGNHGDITIAENATHTGEITGATSLTLDKTAITNKLLVTTDPADHILLSDDSDSGNLKKALISDIVTPPGGTDKQIQYNDSGALGGAANVEIESGNLHLLQTTNPSVTTNGVLVSANVDMILPKLVITDNISSYEILPNLRHKRIGFCVPQNGSTFNNFGLAIGAGASIQGTLTAPTFSLTNLHTKSNRVEILRTSASASNIAGFVANIANYQSEKGLIFDYIWGPATGVSNTSHRSTTGFVALTSVSDINPSTHINCFFFGWDSADTNVHFMHNDGSGTCTKVDMGSNFPVPTVDRTNWYRMIIENLEGVNEIYYKIIDLATGNNSSGMVNTNLPAGDTFLGIRNVLSVGGVSSVAGIAMGNLYIETNH